MLGNTGSRVRGWGGTSVGGEQNYRPAHAGCRVKIPGVQAPDVGGTAQIRYFRERKPSSEASMLHKAVPVVSHDHAGNASRQALCSMLRRSSNRNSTGAMSCPRNTCSRLPRVDTYRARSSAE